MDNTLDNLGLLRKFFESYEEPIVVKCLNQNGNNVDLIRLGILYDPSQVVLEQVIPALNGDFKNCYGLLDSGPFLKVSGNGDGIIYTDSDLGLEFVRDFSSDFYLPFSDLEHLVSNRDGIVVGKQPFILFSKREDDIDSFRSRMAAYACPRKN